MKLNEDFAYVITENDIRYKDKDVVATVKITKGQFEDVEFHFGSLEVVEDKDAGTASIRFEYDILNVEKDGPKVYGRDQELFEEQLGQILNDILMTSLEAAQEKYDNELGKKDSKASDT